MLAGNEIGHGLEGYYVGENGEVKFGDISKAVGEAMLKFGKSTSAEPTRFTDEEVKKFFGVCKVGSIYPAFVVDECYYRPLSSRPIVMRALTGASPSGGSRRIPQPTFSQASTQKWRRSLHLEMWPQ